MEKKVIIAVNRKALDSVLDERFLSYADLSRLSGISYDTLNRIKRTGHSSKKTVRIMAEALQVAPGLFAAAVRSAD